MDMMSRTHAVLLDKLWRPGAENGGAARRKDPESLATLRRLSVSPRLGPATVVLWERLINSYTVWATVILDFLSLQPSLYVLCNAEPLLNFHLYLPA